jgi:hypothetical protein
MNRSQRCLTLCKGRERFVFRCAEGQESNLSSALVSLADDPSSTFNWFDAAALSFQLAHLATFEDEADLQVGTRLRQ